MPYRSMENSRLIFHNDKKWPDILIYMVIVSRRTREIDNSWEILKGSTKNNGEHLTWIYTDIFDGASSFFI